MKVIIEIPDHNFDSDIADKFQDYFSRVRADLRDYPSHDQMCGNYEMETTEMLINSFKNMQAIPSNTTNGDMIKTMFPNVKILINENLGEQGTVFAIFKNPETVILFDLDWWYAPYKEVENDRNNN